jgi:hypothetical protein
VKNGGKRTVFDPVRKFPTCSHAAPNSRITHWCTFAPHNS